MKLHISKMVRSFWAAAAVPALLGVAVALDIPPAADRPLAPEGGPGIAQGLDSVWVMHTIAELTQQNAERKAELQKEREERKVERQQAKKIQGALESKLQALTLRVDQSSCECPAPLFFLESKGLEGFAFPFLSSVFMCLTVRVYLLALHPS